MPASLRYIGQQMQRACATPRPEGTAKALRDVCVTACHGVWVHTTCDWRERYRRWVMSPLDLFNEFMLQLRPQQHGNHDGCRAGGEALHFGSLQ